MSNELTFLVAFATVFGASEAIKNIQSDARRKEHRSRKNNLIVRCLKSCEYSPYLEGRRVVLSGEKLYIDTGTHHAAEFGHPFAGYYLPYPDSKASGLVSTICDDPPVMNWIYVDRWSHELKFGNRSWADDNFPIPWECSRQDRRLTFGGWEGFFAVKEGNFWALYFDVDGDRLKTKVEEGTPVLEVTLLRVEMRLPKPPPPPPPEVKDKEKEGEKAEGEGQAEDGATATTAAAAGADANAAADATSAAAQQGGSDGANNEAGGQAEQQQQTGQQDQEQPQQLEQQSEKQPDEQQQQEQQQAGEAEAGTGTGAGEEASSSSSPDKANGSTFQNGTSYKKPTVEEEEPLESPAVD